jgi:uncharacterized protein
MIARLTILMLLIFPLVGAWPAKADSFGDGVAAFQRGDYVRAARALEPAAQRGDPRAQALLGFLYDNGLGRPQAYVAAAGLYIRAAEQGYPPAQYLLGLMYDKGHGVPQDVVLAYMWLDLSAANATKRDREKVIRLRSAVMSKMTAAEIVKAQGLALHWTPKTAPGAEPLDRTRAVRTSEWDNFMP